MMRVGRARGSGGRSPAVLGFTLVLLAQATIALAALVIIPSPANAFTPHPPIVINGNGEFTAPNGVTGGSGTDSDPYIIEGWEIAATTAYGIAVRNTTAPFILRGNFLHSGGSSFDGIAFERVRNGVASANVVSGNQFGFRVVSSTNVTISANNVSSNLGGMYVGDSSDMSIVANAIASHVWQGVSITNSSLIAIEDNQISDSQSGIFLSTSTSVTLQRNRLTSDGVLLDGDLRHYSSHTITADNLVNGKPLLYYSNCNGLTVDSVPVGELIVANCTGVRATNLDIQGTDVGVLLGFVENMILSRSAIASNDVGISATSSAGVTFEGDWIHDNEYGLIFQNLTDAALRASNVSRNWRGIEFYASRRATLANNTFSGNADVAMILGTADEVRLLGNTVSNNGGGISYGGFSQNVSLLENDVSANLGWGIALSSIANLTLVGNRVTSNGDGIIVGYGSNATLGGNVVASNGEGIRLYGAPLRGPPGVVVRHNVLSNTAQGFDDQGSANAWDDGYPSGGNYWSDYVGVDNCSGPLQDVCPDPDGIGDTPYVIDADTRDRYPLMDPPFLLRIETNPGGLNVRADGMDRTTPALIPCVQGSTHTSEAISPQTTGAYTRHVFVSWSDGGAQTHDLVCNANRTVTANYRTQYRLTMSATVGNVTLTPGSSWQDAGTVVAISCQPPASGADTRYTFLGWLGTGAGSYTGLLNPANIVMSGPTQEVCSVLEEFRNTLDTSPTGLTVIVDGVTIATPQVFWWQNGTSYSIGTASPQYVGTERYELDRWSDGGAQFHAIKIRAPATYIAYFLGPFAGNPLVTVISPNGGEDWTGGSMHSISWTMADDKDATLVVTIDLSTDGGATFPYPVFSGSLFLGVNTFSWALPLVDTTQARIRVCARDSDGLSSCDLSDADFTIDSTRPVLMAILPPNGAVGVDPNASIILAFSEAMNAADTEAALTISPSPGAATYSWDGASRILTVDPPPLMPGTIYTLTVSCGALDSSDPGNALANCPVSSAFTTAVSAVPPQVTVMVPAGGEVWTGGTAHAIEWTMTDPDSGVLSVDLAFSADGGATWTPIATSLLLPQGPNAYVWVLPAMDASAARARVCASDGSLTGCGTSLAFSIDSTPPSIISVSPPDGAGSVPLGAPVVVRFSESMNPATFPIPGVSLAPAVIGLAGTWSPDGRTLTFSHNPFAPCTPYAATVDVGGSDLSLPGNAFTIPYTWSFSTACPPTATLLEPTGGEDWTGGSPHQIRFRVGDESDLQVRVWLNLTVDGVTSGFFLGLVSVGEVSMPWTVPSSSATGTITLTVVDSSGLTATVASDPFAIDATPPALLTTDPADGAGSASVQAPLVLTFSEPMNRVETETAVAISPAIEAASFTWDPSGQVLTIGFGSPLAQFTDYVVTIGCGARDMSDPGNPLDGCPGGTTQVQFRTEILTPPPVAVVAEVPEARVGAPVTLDGGASTGDIAAWAWTIADDRGAVVATLNGAVVTHTFEKPGTHRVTLRVTDAFGRTDEYSFDVDVRAAGGSSDAWVVALVTAGILATILFAASEPGRVALMTATAGRFYGGKPKDGKDSEIRGAILYYVRVHPGDTYMDIKRNLDLNDGVVTYHLARLEKERLIRSAIRGARKRYYPAEMRVPLENGGELHEIQQRILRVVAASPGMPVAVLAEQLGVSTQLALYHLRKLSQAERVDLERAGLRLRAYPGRPGT